jgi:uncharacterized protein
MREFFAILAFLFSATLWSAGEIQASPSLDCKNALTAVETVICHDSELSALDAKLSDTFQEISAGSNGGAALIGEQEVWLQSRGRYCGFERSGGYGLTRATQCLSSDYQRRIAVLAALRMTGPIDCAKPTPIVGKIVCANLDLRSADASVEARVNDLIKMEDDPIHREQIGRDQREWRSLLFRKFESLQITSRNQDAVRDQIHKAYAFRSAQLALLENHEPVITPLPIALPSNWWGTDLLTALGRDDLEVSQAFATSSKSLVLELWPRTEIVKESRTAPGQAKFILVEMVSGRILADDKNRPDLFGTRAAAERARLGLTSLGFSIGGQALSTQLSVTTVSSNCPGPLREAIQYDVVGQYDSLPGRYVVARLAHPTSFDYNRPRCANGEGDSWTADFMPLYTQFLGRLADDTILTVIGGRYVVRFRPDLTSPFFDGRSELVLVDQDALDRLSDADGGPSGPVALQAVEKVIDEAAQAQSTRARR